MSDFNKTLATRKEDLRGKRGGAMSTAAEPRIIWASIIRWPFNMHDDVKPIYKLVRKANEVLEDMVRKYDKYAHIIYIESLTELRHFDTTRKLTASGKSSFWREIDAQMRRFDRGETELNVRDHRSIQKGDTDQGRRNTDNSRRHKNNGHRRSSWKKDNRH